MAMAEKMKPGTIEYKPKKPPISQMITVKAPTAIPAIAPGRVIRDQKTEIRILGPKEAPKPAQA